MSTTGQLRGPEEHEVVVHEVDGTRTYLLDGKPLENDTEVELRMRGRKGWVPVKVTGLPENLDVVFEANDGKQIRTSLSPGVGLRWP